MGGWRAAVDVGDTPNPAVQDPDDEVVRLARPVGGAAGRASRSPSRPRGLTGGRDDGGRRLFAAGVQPERRGGGGPQRTVTGDPPHPPGHAPGIIVKAPGGTAGGG